MNSTLTKKKFKPVTDADLERIDRETAERDKVEPRLKTALFKARERLLLLGFNNGAALHVPLDLLNGFAGASDAQIAAVQIKANGSELHWDELDVQMTVIAVIMRVFKVLDVRENLRRAGSVSTLAKAEAARANGKRGGRPRKVTTVTKPAV